MKNKLKFVLPKFVSAVTMVALSLLLVGPNFALAVGITSAKDTATRLAISTTADHVFSFTLPTGVDFDVTGNTDALQFDFPATFTLGGTWATTDFAFTDSNGSHTVNNVAQGAGTIDCTDAVAQSVCVAIDTTNNIFTVKPATTYTASSTASAITFTILGTASDGTLTNPAAVAATNISVQDCDETAGCTTTFVVSYLDSLAYAIADSDQVSVTATVNSSITFDLDTALTDTESAAPYLVALGTLTTAAASNSDGSAIKSIWVDLSTNAGGGAAVTVLSLNGALKSAAAPTHTIPSATATMAPATANYGICVKSVAQTSGATLTKTTPFDGATCTYGHVDTVGAVTTSAQSILTAATPINAGRAEIVVAAENSPITQAHADYADTLTFIATGTF